MMDLPSGKHLHNYGRSPFLMVKSTISTEPFSIVSCDRLPDGFLMIVFFFEFPMAYLDGLDIIA